ncbi:alcohol oxidase [Imleria badia]|nr:alcohol oxidase [Imleria badia]
MSAAFDIIFAGGEFVCGTTACVIAGRLAAADPSLKILVVESGQHSRDLPCHVQPCRYIENLAPDSTTVSFHVAKPSSHLNGREIVVPCGRSVGGGSTINFMGYVRGAASDYDDWEALGNKGWSFNEVLPLIRKLETFTPISDRPTHGYSGPIQISCGGVDLGIGNQFLSVARVYDPARPQVDDNNDFKTANAYSPAYKYIDPVTGKRCDAASRYLYPFSENLNLKIMVGKRVKRVIIDNGRAVGIEYTTDAISCPGVDGELVTVKASKLVVVSGGAFGSPSILERSGIGAPSVLEKNNVPVLVDLPGVGGNYQDHFGPCLVFYASDEIETMDDVWSDPKAITAHLEEWEVKGTGKIAHKSATVFVLLSWVAEYFHRSGMVATVKMRPTAAQLTSGPALQSKWKTFFQHSPDKPMGMIMPFAGFPFDPSRSMLLRRKLFSAVYYILYPDSIGSVHITSGDDANSPMEFDPDYCSKSSDVEQLTLMYKMTRELARRIPAYRGEVAACHPKFSLDSPAACRETEDPVPADAPDIVYSDADDEAIVKFNRDKLSTIGHSLGTCAMKPHNQGGVVDPRLNVYGVEGLKVADLSICPTNVGNNTYSTALLIGEKAATIIAEDLGMKLV